MNLLFVLLLAALLFAYLAIPLLFPRQSDPLPDLRDPVTQDLEEERDALLRAIRELDARTDLPEARRAALRGRYEAKAAKVLRALDERQREAPPEPPAAPPRGLAAVALTLLAGVLVGATFVTNNLPPEVRSVDGGPPAITGRELQRLERAAARDPSAANLLALADGYWRADNGDAAEALYVRITQEVSPPPAVALQRLGFLRLQVNLAEAVQYLELARNADPEDLETLYILGEVHYASRNMEAAIEAWEAYLEAPGGAGDAEVAARLQLARTFAALLAAAEADPSAENLAALADAHWESGERDRAVDVYFRLLTEADPHHATALSRVGQQLSLGGRFDDAAAVLERALALDPQDHATRLYLGSARFAAGDYAAAADAWEVYARAAAGDERVAELIATARERAAEDALPPTQEELQDLPAELFAEAAGAGAAAAPAAPAASSAVPDDTLAHPTEDAGTPERGAETAPVAPAETTAAPGTTYTTP
ncbi:tetratricopeptide repeat protein [Truepera radiovictrix]|uniref:Tetratricopeptide TPR_2 repeat protein n=1 Tax=Truepera radiovictrix (strain DSM 17093 / CIP 108686 / LMG 22925 / RQ-24) TaxID=649638 RepID=D7CRQ9_TRURR|nr:tetratricopeptide repeat protein [Truepera radiovictrix]ADI13549.1 Tetratricopeptide TPR_2 repeat protein [Truepera radiovictrix DSM 17093]WMT57888.1 tetratricopeptide repeat protein [Truepera radiovictrix]